MVRRAAAALVALLALPALPAVIGVAPASAASTQDAPDPVDVVIQSVTPTTLTPQSILVVSGRVANTTDADVTDVAVRLRLSTAPLTARPQIQAVVDGDPGHDGLRVEASRVELTDRLRPGGQLAYRIAIPAADLPLPQSGVYVLGVEALAGRDGAFDRQGLTRTFLPWLPDPTQVEPTRLVWLWPLADWPARNAAGVLIGDRTPRELSPGGRLRRVLDAGTLTATSLTWIVDPELVQTASAMSGGYRVLQAGTVQPGERAAQAADWLADLQRVLDTRLAPPAPAPAATPSPTGSPSPSPSPSPTGSPSPSPTGSPSPSPTGSPSPSPSPSPSLRPPLGPPAARVLPYADVDAAALQRSGLDQDVVQAVTSAPEVATAALDRTLRGGLFWAPGGDVDQATLDLLAATGVDTVVLSDAAVPPDPAVPFTPSGSASLTTASGTVRAVLIDSGLTAALSMPQQTRGEVLLARQRFLAETALITLELPSTGRTVVAAPDTVRWSPSGSLLGQLLTALAEAPWVQPATLDTLLMAGPSEVRRTRAPAPDPTTGLGADYLDGVRAAQDDLAAFGAVVDDPSGLLEPFAEALLRAQSAAWRVQPRLGAALLRQIRAELAALTGQVRVRSKGTVTFAGERGVIPVTITNDLDRPVTVGLTLVATPAVRLESEPVAAVQVPPGRSRTVEVQARVVGTAPLPVAVQLTTPQGAAYGPPTRIDLRSTAYARAAAGVVGVALVVLAALVGLGLVRRVRRARQPPSGTVAP